MEKQNKARGFFFQLNYYYETHDEHGNLTSNMTVDEWKDDVIQRCKNETFDWLALVFHDKDILKDGSIKPLHAHGLMKCGNPRYVNALMKSLNISRIENIQPVRNYVDTARYLTHISESAINEQKHIYDASEVMIFSDDDLKYQDLIVRTNEKKQRLRTMDKQIYLGRLGEKLQNGELTLNEVKARIVKDYGQFLWREARSSFEADIQEYREKVINDYSKHGRNLKVFYIGATCLNAGGIGKSTLANSLANRFDLGKGIHKAGASGNGKTFDFVSSYTLEDVSILDDCAINGFNFEEFTNIFDNYHYSAVNSRNFDKHWLASTALITHTSNCYDWLYPLAYHQAEYKVNQNNSVGVAFRKPKNSDISKEYWQLRRRLTYVIEFTGYNEIQLRECDKLETDQSIISTHDKVIHKIKFKNIFDDVERETIVDEILKVFGL